MWSIKIGINFFKDKVLAFKDIEVLQQREVFLSQCRPLAIATLPSFEHIFVCPQVKVPPNYLVSKTLHHNLPTSMADHTNKWDNAKLMDGYHLARITTISYSEFGIIINMIIHENILYCVTIGTMP